MKFSKTQLIWMVIYIDINIYRGEHEYDDPKLNEAFSNQYLQDHRFLLLSSSDLFSFMERCKLAKL